MGGIAFSWRERASSLLLLLAACSGGGFEALPGTAMPEEPAPDGDAPATAVPNASDPSASRPSQGQPSEPMNDPAVRPMDGDEPSVEDPASTEPDVCRFLVLHDASGELAVTFADGSARTLAHDPAFVHEYGADVATIGSYAIVGIAAKDFRSDPTLTFFHAERGALWQGTQPRPSDYTRAMGFMSLTREGFALLNDGSVLDANGVQHHIPEAGFAVALPNIDRGGYILVGSAGELAYWDVIGDRIDRAPTANVGGTIVAPVALGGVEGREVAFVEDRGGGALAFTRLSRDEVARVELSPAAVQLARAELDKGDLGELWIQSDSYEGDAALLTAGSRPLAWMRDGSAPLEIEGGAALPPGHYVRSGGGCFTNASIAATTADEFLASIWRVHTDDGALEMGLRFSIPSGLALEAPLAGTTYPLPICIGDGRLAVLLRGAEGFAWFQEGDGALQRITPWTAELPSEPEPLVTSPAPPASERRIVGTWSRPSPPERCEQRYEDDGTTLIDHERGVEHFVPGFATVSWLDRADPAP